MKKFLFPLLAALILAAPSFAAKIGTPYLPEVDNRFDVLEAGQPSADAVDGRKVGKHLIKATWNPSLNSAEGSSTTDSGLHNLNLNAGGVVLPAKSIITNSFMYIVTAPTMSSTASRLSFQCEDSQNIASSINLSGRLAGSIIMGAQGGSTSAGLLAPYTGLIAADCTLKSSVTVGDFSAGKINLFVEYLVTE